MLKRMFPILTSMMFLSLLLANKCSSPMEVQARNSIAAAKGFLDSEKADHPECKQVPSVSTLCSILQHSTAAKDLVIDALELYCAGPDFNSGGKCNPPDRNTDAGKQAIFKLNAAIASLNQSITDARQAIKGK